MATAIPRVALALAALYAGLGVLHLLVVAGSAGWVLSVSAGLSAVLLLALRSLSRTHVLSAARADAALAACAGVGLANSILHLALVPDPQNTANLLMVAFACGLTLLSRRLLLLVVASCAVGFLAVAGSRLSEAEWIHWAWLLAACSVVAGAVQEIRIRTLDRLERMRQLAVQHEREACAALASAEREIARRTEMERRQRTAERRMREFNAAFHGLWCSQELERGRVAAAMEEICTEGARALGGRVSIWLLDDDDTLGRRIAVDEQGEKMAEPLELQREQFPEIFERLHQDRVFCSEDYARDPGTAGISKLPQFHGLGRMLGAPIRWEGRIVGALCVAHEDSGSYPQEDYGFVAGLADFVAKALAVEKRVQAEQALRGLTSRLQRSNEDLEAFASVASHDLQQPIRMVASYLQLLEKRYGDQLDEDGLRYLAYAVDGAHRMRTLVRDILAVARAGREERPFERVALDDLVQEVVDGLELEIRSCDARIEWHGLPVVQGDPAQLRQVLHNLIGNALKYRGETSPRVQVRADRGDDAWLVSVSDNGTGFRSEEAERIFDPFHRLASAGPVEGSGIGLSIARRVAERHGGSIRAEAEPGQGARFTLELPDLDDDPGVPAAA